MCGGADDVSGLILLLPLLETFQPHPFLILHSALFTLLLTH